MDTHIIVIMLMLTIPVILLLIVIESKFGAETARTCAGGIVAIASAILVLSLPIWK